MQSYAEDWTLSQHAQPVTFVAFSPSGELLATGDDDGYVHIWSLASKELFQSLHKCSKEAVSCCWGDDKEIFVGSGTGELHFYEHVPSHNRFVRRSKFHVDENRFHIASLAVSGNRLVCCSGNFMHCYKIEDSELIKLFSWSMSGVREIRSVHFLDRQTVLAATIREGECILLDVADPAHHLWRRKLRHKIGESAVTTDGKFLAVTTLASSVRIYEISATGLALHYDLAAPNRLSSNFPLQVCFAESHSMIVCGSDCGVIRMWDLSSGDHAVLHHSRGSNRRNDGLRLVQAVATRSTANDHLIASACSDHSGFSVKIWRKPRRVAAKFELRLILAFMLAVLVIVLFRPLPADIWKLPRYLKHRYSSLYMD